MNGFQCGFGLRESADKNAGLIHIGAPASDAIKPMPTMVICPVCHYTKLPDEPCPTCQAAAQAEAQEEAKRKAWDIKRLGGIKAYDRFHLANYENQAAIDSCAGYPDKNLYLWGAAGTGKTHLATAIVRGYMDGRVVKPQSILRKLRGLKNGTEEQVVIDRLAEFKHLVIDDLGVEKSTAFSLSALYEIIEARDMNYAKGLIVTSNLSLGALAERLGDDRITSRLSGMCKVIEIGGKDRRQNK